MGGLYGHPHGYCCAVSLPVIMAYNMPVCAQKYARLAVALGADGAGAPDAQLAATTIDAIRALNRDLDIPPMSTMIRAEDLDVLGDKAAQNTSSPSNPRAATAADYREMFAREI